jgi:hypothetical protein
LSSACHFLFAPAYLLAIRATVKKLQMMMNFLFDTSTLPVRSDFIVAGVHCALSTNSEQVADCLKGWPASYGAPGSLAESDARTLQIDILESQSRDSRAVDTRPDSAMHFRGLGHLVFALLGPENQFVFDLLRNRVFGAVSPATARDSNFWNRRLLPILFGTFGATLSLAPLHCACLDYAGDALLIAGVGGAGKSTLTAALLQNGFSLLSDDCAFISANPESLLVHGLGLPFKLLPDAVQFFPEIRPYPLGRSSNGELCYELHPSALGGADTKFVSRPRWILFLQRDDQPGSRLVSCDKQFVHDFFESAAELMPDEIPQAQAIRSQIIRRVGDLESYLLKTGDSPHKLAEFVANFCATGVRS